MKITSWLLLGMELYDEEIAKSAAKCVQENGAAGIIIITGEQKRNTWFSNIDCPLPAVSLTQAEGNKIKSLVNEVRIENRKMYARIHEAKEPAEELYVAGFSSRGHNPSSDDIPKPDFTAPGTLFLLCCSRLQEKTDDNRQCHKLASGTSYAAPVVAGAMLALKASNMDREHDKIILHHNSCKDGKVGQKEITRRDFFQSGSELTRMDFFQSGSE